MRESHTTIWLPARSVIVLFTAVFPLGGQDRVDSCFDKLPLGWQITRSFVASPQQTEGIGKKLGASLNKLSNTYLLVQGQPIQVNILEATSDPGAATLHQVISKMKEDPAFCVRKGRKVIEFTGESITVALATMVSYELGFVRKPRAVRYRVIADVATVDEADYMAFNELFNLFLKLGQDTSKGQVASRIAELSGRFRFGNRVTLRTSGRSSRSPAYEFSPPTTKTEQAEHAESVTFSFGKTRKVQGVPYVTLTADITVLESGVTPTRRKAEKDLLAPTDLWPAADPEVQRLANRITSGLRSDEAKVRALLKWLAPGKNIRFGGLVPGSRYGVKKVLGQKYGQCWDFSDCFVTLCRAAGIPCRQVGGWLYGVSGHIWAEVLLEGKGWQQVDPTGGGVVACGIYHIPYFATEDGNMPLLYVSMPEIEIVEAK